MSITTIRDATADDMGAIAAIYATAVASSVATFETSPPSEEEMCARYSDIRVAGRPYIVAVDGVVVLGYAYATTYKPRAAYNATLENAIYVAERARGRGVGKLLLSALVERAETAGYRQMVALIADPAGAGAASVALHRRLGFADAGLLSAVGWKFGRWIDTAFMQRPLGPGPSTPLEE